MRISTSNAAWLSACVLLAETALVAQLTPGPNAVATGSGALQLVCVDRGGDAVRLEKPVPGTEVQETWRAFGASSRGAELSHCWAWNESCAPTRLLPGEEPVCEIPGSIGSRLEVHLLFDQGDRTGAQAPTRLTTPPQLTAAPVEMWEEVPKSLLPTTVASARVLSMPRSPGSWRVQAWAEGLASAFQDVAADEGTVEVVLLPAVEFSTRVTAGGEPLGDARLFVVRPSWRGQRYPADLLGFETSGADGAVALTLPARTRWPAVLFSATRRATALPRLRDLPAAVELSPGVTVSGHTVNEEGAPLAGAVLVGLSWIPEGFNLMQRHRAVSGFDGRFELAGLAPGVATLRAAAGEKGFARELELEGALDLGRIVLASPETVWIRVTEKGSRTPLRNARVQIGGSEWASVDQNGLARVAPLLGRDLLADADGYLLAQSKMPEQAGQSAEEPFVVELEAAFTVKGTYVAGDGTPAVGGRLAAIRGASNDWLFDPIAPDGSFEVDLKAGSYRLELSAGNLGLLRLSVSGRAGQSHDLGVIVAGPSTWTSGTVVSKADYRPVPDASVSYVRPSEFGPLIARALGNVEVVSTNDNGYFELHGLEPGSSTLRVEADGFASQEFEVQAGALEWHDAGTIELSYGRRVTVRSDVNEGSVQLDQSGTGRWRIQGVLVEGEVTLDAVPDGPYRLRVFDKGALVCEKENEAPGEGVVTCDRMAVTVVGRVTVGDRPADGMLLWKQKKRASTMPEAVITTVGRGLPQTQIVSDQEQEMETMIDHAGSYRLEAVLPGAWDVIWAPAGGGMQEVRELSVPDGPGSQAVVDLHFEGVSIEGVVVLPDGQPVHLASVEVFPGRQVVVSDREGRFRVHGLQPNEYQLRARQMDFRSDLVDVELRKHGDGETVQLTLRDDPQPDELTIYVQGGGGGLCFVETESSMASVVRIDGGRAVAAFSPPLADRLRVACQSEGRFVLGDWQDLRQALDRGIEFDPTESVATIVLAGGAADGAAIQITGPGGWDLGSLRLWFGGASTFSVGESVANLPLGSYTLRWGERSRTVWTERRRATVVEIAD